MQVVAGPATAAVRSMTKVEQLTQWRAEVAEEALHAVRADASRVEVRGFLSLLDQIDARLAALREDDDDEARAQRRAAVAMAKTEVKVNGVNRKGERTWAARSLPAKQVNPAQRKALNKLSIRSGAA